MEYQVIVPRRSISIMLECGARRSSLPSLRVAGAEGSLIGAQGESDFIAYPRRRRYQLCQCAGRGRQEFWTVQ